MPSQSRLDSARDVRNSPTDSLLTLDDRFIKKSRKAETPRGSAARSFCFPNGEVFTPRNTPAKRNKPAKMPSFDRKPEIPRCGSMVLVSSLNLSQPGTYLTKSASFNNLKMKFKQDLVLLIRNNKLDTPTNINISYLAATSNATSQLLNTRLFLLTNNRYNLNSTNIVRLELLLHTLSETFGHGKPWGSDLNPSSLSNYNLNRTNSNSPQTSVSTADNINDTLPSENYESPSSIQKISSLEKIQESTYTDMSGTRTSEGDSHKLSGEVQTVASPKVDTGVLESQQQNFTPKSKASLNSTGNSGYDTANEFSNAEDTGSDVDQVFNEHSDKASVSHEEVDNLSTHEADNTSYASDSGSSSSKEKENNNDSTCHQSAEQVSCSVSEVKQDLIENPDSGELAGIKLPSHDSSLDGHVADTETSGSGNSSTTGKRNPSESEHLDNSDHSSKGNQDPSEDSQTCRDLTRETTDTMESLNTTIDLVPVSPIKRSESSSIVHTTSSEPEEPKELEPTGEEKSNTAVAGLTISDSSVLVNCINEEKSSPISKDSNFVNTDKKSTTEASDPPVQSQLKKQVVSMIIPVEVPVSQSHDAGVEGVGDSVESKQAELPVKEPVKIVSVQAKPVKSLLEPLDNHKEGIKQVKQVFSKRKNGGLQLNTNSESMMSVSDLLPDVPTPISNDGYHVTSPAVSNTNNLVVLQQKVAGSQTPTHSTHLANSPYLETINTAAPVREFSFKSGEEILLRKSSGNGSAVSISALYSQGQIEKYLCDDQEEVPPRGDLDIQGNQFKLHETNRSSISSMNPILQRRSSHADLSPVEITKSPIVHTQELLQNRSSILDVVDVDFDTSLSSSPERKNNNPGHLSLFGEPFASPTNNESPQRLSAKKANKSEKSTAVEVLSSSSSLKASQSIEVSSSYSNLLKSGSMAKFKKVFKMFSSDSKLKAKKENDRKLANKSLTNSFRSWRSGNPDTHLETSKVPMQQPDPKSKIQELTQVSSLSLSLQDADSSFNSSKLTNSLNKRKKFVLNLKLASMARVDELPSPVYSVRERPLTPDVPPLERQPSTKFNLPNFEVENDTFDDLLLKFDEVEKEVEKEVEQQLTSPKLARDFFLKDDELTRAQIVDQQKNDIQLSDESLPRKFQRETHGSSSTVNEVPIMDEPLEDLGISWPSEEEVFSKMKLDDLIVELSSEHREQHILLKKEGLMTLLSDQMNRNFPAYLKHVKQFLDFDEIEIKLKSFDPSYKEEVVASGSIASPILKSSPRKSSGNRSVKFSNTIFISETFPSYMYKRYNKSVTQYYLTEFAEVNRIKNELNAYKCHEMLVHEKSQMNTHFFY